MEAYFKGLWTKFLDWFGAAEAAVVAEGKTIIDELVPVVEKDLLADGSKGAIAVGEALATGASPLAAITAVAPVIIADALSQGLQLSEQAAATAGAFLVAKAQAATASSTSGSATAA